MTTGSVALHPSAPAGAGRECNSNTEPTTIHKRIGSIVYEVEIHFNPDAKETMKDKTLRLIRRDMETAS